MFWLDLVALVIPELLLGRARQPFRWKRGKEVRWRVFLIMGVGYWLDIMCNSDKIYCRLLFLPNLRSAYELSHHNLIGSFISLQVY
jgi:hypothetical protein